MIGLLTALGIIVVLLVIGVPIGFAFAGAVLFLTAYFQLDPGLLLPSAFFQTYSVVLLSLPMFIFAGRIMGEGGIATPLINLAETLVGRVRGGLGIVLVFSCALFGAISGTASSAVAAIGTVMIPRMEEAGYPRGYTTGLISCSSLLGQLIPPSVPMILFAWITRQSIAACFLSTVGPGLLMIVLYAFLNWLMCRRIPTIKVGPRLGLADSLRETGRATRHASFALMMPVLILGGIYGGLFTPTEAASVAALYGIPVGFWIYKGLTLKKLWQTTIDSAATIGAIVIMFLFILVASRVFTMQQVPQMIVDALLNISENKIVILMMANVFLLIVGMLMDDISGTLIAAPLLMPLMLKIGVHPVQFAAIVGTNLAIGANTPPTAPILYLAGRIGGVTIEEFIKPVAVLLLFGSLPVALATTYWPDLSLFLPRLMGYVH
ncbi:MAG TPA: TRAP transporter large permease [Desulfovibrio sp.]|uniref:TRAP transporter large permease n=1 Tax=Desulfovibrio sp. TaxID=885 RepID=UPI002C596152|nr:TRAP transporter large permease [Desulfovibrio sp.]HMM38556.1 TRAP transporter large permease [Desulfovibrio sp.]